MAQRIIDINKHLKDDKKRFEEMFRNLYTSFEIEGIKIPLDEAKRIAKGVMDEMIGIKSRKIHG
jgi:hypothetical protein